MTKFTAESLESRTLLSVSDVRLVEIGISKAAITADPALAGYRSFDLMATFTPGDGFNAAGIHARLWKGSFYQAPGASSAVTPAAIWSILPQYQYSTFVTLPGFIPPPSGTLPYELSSPVFTDTVFRPVWGNQNSTPALSGEHTIARVTISNDAIGSIYGQVGGRVNPQESGNHYFFGSLPNGRAVGKVSGHLSVQSPGHVRNDLSNWTVYSDENHNGQHDAGEPSTVSGAQGQYTLIAGVGLKSISVVVPKDYAIPPKRAGFAELLLQNNVVQSNVDFKLTVPEAGRIQVLIYVPDGFGTDTYRTDRVAGDVYIDINRNGVRDHEDRLQTNASSFRFDNVPPRNYCVTLQARGSVMALPGLPTSNEVDVPPWGTANAAFYATHGHIVSGRITVANATEQPRSFGGAVIFDDVNNDGDLGDGEPRGPVETDGTYMVFPRGYAHTINLRLLPPPLFTLAAGSPQVYTFAVPSPSTNDHHYAGRDFVILSTAAAQRAFSKTTVPIRSLNVNDLFVDGNENELSA